MPPNLSAYALPQISFESPAGPDLDHEGDAAFANFFAMIEGQIPENYYDFKPEALDFPSAFATAQKLLERTIDLRLMILLAKLSLLNRDLAGFARWVGGIAWGLSELWPDVHPQGDGDDYSLRLTQLAMLDDSRLVIRALKYAPLLETSREGALSYRAHLVMTGKEKPRVVSGFDERGQQQAGVAEKFISDKAAERLLRTIDQQEIAAVLGRLGGLTAAIQAIGAITTEKVGFENATQLPALAKLVAEMADFLQGELYKRDPSLVPEAEAEVDAGATTAAPAAKPPSAFASLAEVDQALGAAMGYFLAREPSSPALLLIRQTRETLGKNLYEVMKLLTPAFAENARLFVGPDSAFTVPVKALAGAPTPPFARSEPPPAPDRASALALVDAVAAHMQRVEPTSPAPHLLQRARSLATRDFLSLLLDVLPEDAIAALKKGR